MTKRITASLLGLALAAAAPVAAQTEWTSSRPDGHAPIGVMGDHTHEAGEFMFSYRFMHMGMEGMLDGTAEVPNDQVVSPTGYDFMVTPTEMPMQMHMVGAMYAPSDRVTLMAMFNYLSKSMDHVTRAGGAFTTESGGFGDIGVTALVGLVQEGPNRLHLNLGATLPTGTVEAMDETPASGGSEVQLPYPMQIGTGTFALQPGFTYLGMAERVSWGAQGRSTFQLGENDRDWKVGNQYMGTTWFGFRATEQFSLSARLAYQRWENYSGTDAAFGDLMMVPTVNADLLGGQRLDVPLGANFWVASGALRGLRVLAEYALPVWQNLNGPQLETTGVFTVGVQLSVEPG